MTIEDILSHRAGTPSCDNASLSWGGKSKSDYSAISPLILPISLSTFLQSDGTKTSDLSSQRPRRYASHHHPQTQTLSTTLKHCSRVPTHSLYLLQYYVHSSAGPHRDSVKPTAIQRPERPKFGYPKHETFFLRLARHRGTRQRC